MKNGRGNQMSKEAMKFIDDISEEDINRLQSGLYALRCMAGWTTTDLAKKLGVTGQTIRSLEKNDQKYHMTKLQYIGLQWAFYSEMKTNPENENLSAMYKAVIESSDVSASDIKKINTAIDTTVVSEKNHVPPEEREAIFSAIGAGAIASGSVIFTLIGAAAPLLVKATKIGRK